MKRNIRMPVQIDIYLNMCNIKEAHDEIDRAFRDIQVHYPEATPETVQIDIDYHEDGYTINLIYRRFETDEEEKKREEKEKIDKVNQIKALKKQLEELEKKNG